MSRAMTKRRHPGVSFQGKMMQAWDWPYFFLAGLSALCIWDFFQNEGPQLSASTKKTLERPLPGLHPSTKPEVFSVFLVCFGGVQKIPSQEVALDVYRDVLFFVVAFGSFGVEECSSGF